MGAYNERLESDDVLGPLITAEQLGEFRQLYQHQFGEELSEKEALAIVIPFLGLVQAIGRPVPLDATPSCQLPIAGYNEDTTNHHEER